MADADYMAAALGNVPLPQPRPTYFDERWNIPNKYPTQEDVEFSKKYDTTYGDPSAAFLSPGGAKIRSVPADLIPYVFNSNEHVANLASHAPSVPVAPDEADRLRQAWIASQRSSVSALGFDPRKVLTSPQNNVELNVSGLYSPKADAMWYDYRDPAALTHESMHRGIRQLRDAGKTEVPAGRADELMVRALMLRNFGDVELNNGTTNNRQVEQGREIMNDPRIADAEKEAALMYHQKNRRMGPR